MKASKELLKKLNISENDATFLILKEMLKNNVGYMFMFTHFAYVENIQMYALRDLYNTLKENKNILGDLPKPAANYRSYADLVEDLQMVKKMSAVKQFIQVCPSNLKQKIRNAKSSYSPDFVNSCHSFVELPKFKQHLFTLTISRYRTFNQISSALVRFIEYHNNGTDIFSTIELINNTKNAFIRLIDFDNNVVIARVRTKPAVVELGKGTGWCIADPHMPQYWSQYVSHDENTVQYVLFDFNYPVGTRRHKIGITVQNQKISHAHMFGNDPIAPEDFPVYINLDVFKSNDIETTVENDIAKVLYSRLNTNDLYSALSHIIINNGLSKLIAKKPNIKILKSVGKIMIDNISNIDINSYNEAINKIFDVIGSTKIFNSYIPTLHLMTVETAKKLANKGLILKYGVHLNEILETYFKNDVGVKTSVEYVTIDNIRYKKEITLTPLYSLNLDVLDIILSTNEKIVTSKSLKYANDIDNMELFKVLLKNFNGTFRSYNSLKPEFKNEFDTYVASL